MTTQIQRRRGTTTEHGSFTGAVGEITIDTTKDTVVVHDGSTAGGHPLAKENNPSFTGNVGIGTSSPTSKLEVHRGTISLNATTSSDTTKLRWNYQGTEYQYIERDNATGGLAFGDNTGERMRIDTSGRLLVGTSTARPTGGSQNRYLQVEGTSYASAGLSLTCNSTSNASTLNFARSRGTSVGSSTVVQDGDDLGYINFSGADGTDAATYGAWIVGQVDGTPGSNDMPGRLVFATNSGSGNPTERLRIDSSGNVGIGTTSPTSYANSQKTLVIEDSGNPAICWSDTGQTRDWWAIASGSALSFKYADGGGSSSASNVTNVLQLDNSGKVGIGTTSPASLLDVNTGATGSTAAGFVTNPKLGIGGDIFFEPGSGNNVQIFNYRSTAMAFGTSGVEKMRIDSSGNLGVGTSSPSGKLHVNGTGIFESAITAKTYIQGHNSSLTFYGDSSAGSGDAMVLTSSGRLGIGVSSPAATLDVQDLIRIRKNASNRATLEFQANSTRIEYSDQSGDLEFYTNSSRRAFVGYQGNFTIVSGGLVLNAGNITFSGADRSITNNDNNALTFGTNATERMRLSNSGQLYFGGTSNSTAKVNLGNATDGGSIYVRAPGNQPTWAAFRVIDNTNADANSAVIYSNGGAYFGDDVGIGTTSPLSELHVESATSAHITVRTASSNMAQFGSKGDDVYIGGTSGAADVVFKKGVTSNTHPADSGTETVRITSAGNVGIGTSSPNALLQVGETSVNSARGIRIKNNDNTGTAVKAQLELLTNQGTSTIGATNPGNIILSPAGGKVGIGTTAPGQLLTLSSASPRILLTQTSANSNAFVDAATSGVLEFSADDNNVASSSSMRFKVDGTERIRIEDTGRSMFTASTAVTYIESAAAAGTTHALITGAYSSGTVSLRVWTNGNIQNTNNSYGALSDVKLKENIVDASSQWDDIKDLRVRNYNFIEGQTHTQIGVVAQEVETVSPGLVTESPDLDAEGNDLGTTTKSVNYSVLYMKAVKALQEAMDRIETLETKVAALEAG